MAAFKREILKGGDRDTVVKALQAVLVDMIDLSLQLKQAHWCVKGPRFLPVHKHLDEIIDTTRDASDEIAERISTLGAPPQGHSQTIAETSRLERYPETFVDDGKTITLVADRLDKTIKGLRSAIDAVGTPDPISQDLLIGISGELEKHLWMVQAHEAN